LLGEAYSNWFFSLFVFMLLIQFINCVKRRSLHFLPDCVRLSKPYTEFIK
jgi:hypothetical protein